MGDRRRDRARRARRSAAARAAQRRGRRADRLRAAQRGADVSDVALAAGALWVASTADRRVYALEPDGATNKIDAGEGPVALAADARRVVAVDAPAGSITVIDARQREFAGQVRVGGTPVDVALTGDAAWVADAAGGRLVRVDLGSLRVTHTLASAAARSR